MKQIQRTDVSKEQIVKAAIYEFGKYDFPYASQRRICEVGGFTNAALLRQFGHMDELYLECVTACYEQLHAHLEGFQLHTQDSLEGNLLRLHRCWQNFFRISPEKLRIFIRARVAPPPGLKSRLDAVRKVQFVDCLHEKLQEIVCFYMPDDTQQQTFLVDSWMGMLENIVIGVGLHNRDLYPENFEHWLHAQEELFQSTVRMLLYGLSSEQVQALAKEYAMKNETSDF